MLLFWATAARLTVGGRLRSTSCAAHVPAETTARESKANVFFIVTSGNECMKRRVTRIFRRGKLIVKTTEDVEKWISYGPSFVPRVKPFVGVIGLRRGFRRFWVYRRQLSRKQTTYAFVSCHH